jgi:hypothetical protein
MNYSSNSTKYQRLAAIEYTLDKQFLNIQLKIHDMIECEVNNIVVTIS